MVVQSWLDGSMDGAIEMLAKRSVVARRIRGAREKTAIDWEALSKRLGGYGTKALDWVNAPGEQHLRYPLVGAGVGGLLGGLSSLGRPKEERQTLRSALMGGMAGAGVGLGGGLLAKNWSKLFPPSSPGAGDEDPLKGKNEAIRRLESELAKIAPGTLPSYGSLGTGVGLAGASEVAAGLTPGALRRGAGTPPRDVTQGSPANILHGGGVRTRDQLRAIAEAHGLRSPLKPKPGVPAPIPVDIGDLVLQPSTPKTPPWYNPKRWQSPFSLKQTRADLPATAMPGFSRGNVRAMGRTGARSFRKSRLGLLLAAPYILQLLRRDKAQQGAEETAVKAYRAGKS